MKRLPQLSDFAIRCTLTVLFVAEIFGLGVLVATVAQCLPPESAAPILIPSAVRPLASPTAASPVRETPVPLSFVAVEPDRIAQHNFGPRVEAMLWAVEIAFPSAERAQALAVAWCESGFDPAVRYVDVNGEWSVGAWSVQPVWWGAVPTDLAGQAAQAAAIVAEHGWRWWSCWEGDG